ncbi:ubiquitin domain-containing protein UBFD1 [Trichonephila inaurata madagascariensis]|uniref:Ubiquitin domain-containing protein UBFD1 n=1 Tax=Trichonephila inaurata madagascariensis TaxID=2747483 RepID=A0A8X6KHQ3_9ARAC|nr:ubiquitin domain-containing protein UBFD1 [Trichonephila inaurata madagascariensis]
MDTRNNFWYFCHKPSFRIPFLKDAHLPVDDSPVEINSTSCPTNSIPSNTAENSIPYEANDVDATPETDSSTKSEGNASVMRKNRASGSKDMRIGSGNEPINKDMRYNERTKIIDMVTINSQQGGFSPERFDVEEHYTERYYLPQNKADSEDYSSEARHDTSPVTYLSPRPRSYIPSNKRNEKLIITIQTGNMMGKRKGISITVPIQVPEGEGVDLILLKSIIIKIKLMKMLEDKIMAVK